MARLPGILAWCIAVSTAAPLFSQDRPQATSPTPSSRPLTYSVVYTGRLFGYFRYPEQQEDATRDGTNRFLTCADITAAVSGPAAAFQRDIVKLAPKDPNGLQVRVAVGDNFAPFLLARNMWWKEGPTKEEAFKAKDQLVFDDGAQNWVRAVGAPESLTAKLANGVATLPIDNVACFMRLAKFDAIVPGKQDFYFGPERLRGLAGLLARTPEKSAGGQEFQPVQMLGANLSIATKEDSKRIALPARDIPHEGYETSAPADLNRAAPVLPKVVLPWLRRIRIANAIRVVNVSSPGATTAVSYDLDDLLRSARFVDGELQKLSRLESGPVTIEDAAHRKYDIQSNVGTAIICDAGPTQPNVVQLPVADPKKPKAGSCFTLTPSPRPEDYRGKLSLTMVYHRPANPPAGDDDFAGEFAITPHSNQALCLYAKPDRTGTPYCELFSVHVPMFEDPAGKGITPFVLKQGPQGDWLAIFGAVDPGLREYVGALNDTWLTKTPDRASHLKLQRGRETDVEVTDPVESLSQLLQYCDARPACKTARKILLAQMPRAKASQIASRFKSGTFDLVIAQSDYDRASGTVSTTRRISFTADGDFDEVAEPAALVPGSHFTATDPETIRVRLQQATVHIQPEAARAETVSVDNVVNPWEEPGMRPFPPAATVSPLPELGRFPAHGAAQPLFGWVAGSASARALLPGAAPTNRSDKVSLLENLALTVMGHACHADVAILQHRDVFTSARLESPSVDQLGLRAVLDAIFWKGDFVVCREITGATLKAVLARSKEIAAAESNSALTDLEFGRGLATLGVFKKDDDKLIDGQFINDKKIYSAAMTDFIAEGDTGYSILQTADPKVNAIGRLGALSRLSALVFRDLTGVTDPDEIDLKADQYLDASTRLPLDSGLTTSPTATGQGFVDWFHDFFSGKPATTGASAAERAFQERSLSSLTLQTLGVSIANLWHSRSQEEVERLFSGAPNTALVAPNSNTFAADLEVRGQRSVGWSSLYALTEIHFSRDVKARNGGDSISEDKNQWNDEAGLLLSRWPFRHSDSSYRILIGGRFETQLRQPFLTITLPDNPSQPHNETHARERLAYGKLGMRHEFRDSAFEAGALAGRRWGSPVGFDFRGTIKGVVTQEPLTCDLQLGQSVQACVTDNDVRDLKSVTMRSLDRNELGLFLNVRLHFPLPLGQMKFLSDEKGLFFANRRNEDVPLDTRYSLTWKNALEVPMWGNFNIAPSVEWFWYQSKMTTHSFHSVKFSADFKYTFDWHSGLRWRKTLSYANPPGGQ